eukprot:scaffold42658_cov19-Tisochrysis_lutea.AAC.2
MRGAWRGFLRTRWGCCSTLAYKVARLSVVHIHRGHLKSIQLTPRNWRPNWAGQKVQVQAKQEKPSECLHFVRPQRDLQLACPQFALCIACPRCALHSIRPQFALHVISPQRTSHS